jgi:hypothetical protein
MPTSEGEKPKLKDPNPEALKLAFEESKDLTVRQDAWIEAIDQKLVAVFTLASAVAGLVPALADTSSAVWLWRAGGAAWFVAAALSLLGFWPRKMFVSPNPDGIYKPAWLAIEIDEYRMKRLWSLGTVYLGNKELISRKAGLLRYAMVGATVEVALFALAIFV